MVRKLNLFGFILMNCLFFLVQAADPDPNQGQSSGQNGRNPREQQAAAWLNAFLAQPQAREQLSTFIYQSLNLGGIDLAAGHSLGDLCLGMLSRLASLQGADVQKNEEIALITEKLDTLKKSDAEQNDTLNEFETFASRVSESITLLRTQAQLIRSLQETDADQLLVFQKKFEENCKVLEQGLHSVEERVTKNEKSIQFLQGAIN